MQAVLLTFIVMTVLTVWVTTGETNNAHIPFVVISVCKGKQTGPESPLAHVLKLSTANNAQLVRWIDKRGRVNVSSLGLKLPRELTAMIMCLLGPF